MNSGTVTMGDFARIVSEGFRSAHAVLQKGPPFELAATSKTYARRYGPAEIMEWGVLEALRRRGHKIAAAGRLVRMYQPGARYLREFGREDGDVLSLAFVLIQRLELNNGREEINTEGAILTASEIADRLSCPAAGIGQPFEVIGSSTPKRPPSVNLGQLSTLIVPLAPIWVRAVQRARREGFNLTREGIFPLEETGQ